MSNQHILILEPFYGGSHMQLVNFLKRIIDKRPNVDVTVITMTDKKWHWRMRTSSLYFAEAVPVSISYSCIFASSVLNMAELLALRPDLMGCRRLLYFHENQLVYPVRKEKERDFQYGYNQVVSCLVADQVLFNSHYNMTSFLSHMPTFMKLMPDYRPKDLVAKIQPKCKVLYFPIQDCFVKRVTPQLAAERPLHILWPHRWEHDKNPDEFFEVLLKLKSQGLVFCVSVLGQSYSQVPEIFERSKVELADNILNWGYQDSREQYTSILQEADVVVSTAVHEFFGVAMLEAVTFNCYPLCPNRLVYPEIFPKQYLYNTTQQLLKMLRKLCKYPKAARDHRVQVDLRKFSEETLRPQYLSCLGIETHQNRSGDIVRIL